nr:iron-containing alcohol dehydrogenase family protein [Maliibacterium massiliense]
MEYGMYIPTRVVAGRDCVKKHAALLGAYGTRAFIVTSPSAHKNGALADVKAALASQNITYGVFDRCISNPTWGSIEQLAAATRDFAPDFIVGIGGGSPLDSAKAAAVMATNAISVQDLYTSSYAVAPLAMVMIPTTAGTGSELTPYSVLTVEEEHNKRSFGGEQTYPSLALLDAKYTASLPYNVTVDTAIDALCHNIESYLAENTSPLCAMTSRAGLELFGKCVPALLSGEFSAVDRENLLLASLYGGFGIDFAKTVAVHGMGYALTSLCDIPHGRANGMLICGFLKYVQDACPEKIKNILLWLGMDSVQALDDCLQRMMGETPRFAAERLAHFADLVAAGVATRRNPVPMTRDDVLEVFKLCLLQK